MMEVKTFCKNCIRYYCFFDDDGELLVEGCKLDIPLFNSKKTIVCNSYVDR